MILYMTMIPKICPIHQLAPVPQKSAHALHYLTKAIIYSGGGNDIIRYRDSQRNREYSSNLS